ncbi:MAG: methyltransferase [Candidatus Eisenbacteria bacterium]|nr:methyltransferase [Candidatus Eisenbacteria bacterium]
MDRTSYEITASLKHGERTFRSAGGLFSKNRIAKSTSLLVNAISPGPGNRILDYGCGYGAVGIALADSAPGLDIQMVDSDIRAVRLAQRNTRANEVRNAHVLLDHTLNRFPNGSFNIVALNPPVDDGTELIFEMIERAQPKLRHGGFFFLVAKSSRGARSYMKKLTRTVGPAKVVKRSGGYWVMRAERSPIRPPEVVELSRYEHTVEGILRGRKYSFRTRAGIFSRKAIDDGTALLIESIDVRPRHSVIDIGCGYGPIGIVCAHLASVGRVVMVDCDARAVEYADLNIRSHHLNHARKNGKPRVEAVLGDRFDAVPGERFDRVVSNPPFHAGVDVLHPLVEEAHQHLRIHGRMYLVLMRYRGVLKQMRRVFGNAAVVAEGEKHVVVMSERTR